MAPDSVPDPKLASALARALTGQQIELSGEVPVAEALARVGFDADALGAVRRERQHAREPWPFEVPIEDLRAIGFARFDAALAALRRELGLTGLAPATPAHRRLNRDEQRLVADRPPHWG
ncbi:hypothetical protein [Tessaracoccus palaemonis]|uniref:Uncharacterized protein n=1 Tax=Tessaracoccus palaemonis TaxID=2829499 RepID=A0ABX8SJ39_9ACTN|nr:hypothetical protein [Tessaracoccus palaemonis]QXT63402.1 hypothetical protein KDB89_02645 [Tessaracoccus palaemonis]